jgi:alpha-tubulin suppressor-like RCC1 family protein
MGLIINGQKYTKPILNGVKYNAILNGKKVWGENFLSGVHSVFCGGAHTMLIKSDGTLWATGDNNIKQLGIKNILVELVPGVTFDQSYATVFTQVSIDNVQSVSCGHAHTMLVKSDGTLWATGDNEEGQLGLGNTTNPQVFTQVSIDNVQSVSCGNNYTMAIKSNGSLWATGDNSHGQLGLGYPPQILGAEVFTQVTISINEALSVACSNYKQFTLLKQLNDSLWVTGLENIMYQNPDNIKYVFTQVSINGVQSFSCGGKHAMLVKSDGTLWATGDNYEGQLGLGNQNDPRTITQVSIDNVQSVSCGHAHTMLVKSDGTLWATGDNSHGQLGLGNQTNRNVFTQVSIDNVQSVSCGNNYTMAIKPNGSLWATGLNNKGQLGLGNQTNRNVFTQV